jgi:hypothetical protein
MNHKGSQKVTQRENQKIITLLTAPQEPKITLPDRFRNSINKNTY